MIHQGYLTWWFILCAKDHVAVSGTLKKQSDRQIDRQTGSQTSKHILGERSNKQGKKTTEKFIVCSPLKDIFVIVNKYHEKTQTIAIVRLSILTDIPRQSVALTGHEYLLSKSGNNFLTQLSTVVLSILSRLPRPLMSQSQCNNVNTVTVGNIMKAQFGLIVYDTSVLCCCGDTNGCNLILNYKSEPIQTDCIIIRSRMEIVVCQ